MPSKWPLPLLLEPYQVARAISRVSFALLWLLGMALVGKRKVHLHSML